MHGDLSPDPVLGLRGPGAGGQGHTQLCSKALGSEPLPQPVSVRQTGGRSVLARRLGSAQGGGVRACMRAHTPGACVSDVHPLECLTRSPVSVPFYALTPVTGAPLTQPYIPAQGPPPS